MFNGARSWVGSLFGFTSSSVAGGLALLLLLLLFRVVFRRDWAAMLALAAFYMITGVSDVDESAITSTNSAAAILSVFVLVKVGLLATVVGLMFINLLFACSLTANTSA